MQFHKTTLRPQCRRRSSNQSTAHPAARTGSFRFADISRLLEITYEILECETWCALAVEATNCTIQDVARMCYLIQRWREHRDLLRAIEETFPASGLDPIASSLAQLQDPAIAKALRSFVSSELTAFTHEAKVEEIAAMGCITWQWHMRENLGDAIDELVPPWSKKAS